MKRSYFIKTLGLGSGGILLPNSYIIGKPIKIYDNYVRGIIHYQFPKIKKIIKAGDELLLMREPENVYDSFAIQVQYNKLRIGYIAAYENIVLANMLNAGINLTAFVSKIDLTHSSIYEAIAIEIYADMVQPTKKLIDTMIAEQRADDANDVYRKMM